MDGGEASSDGQWCRGGHVGTWAGFPTGLVEVAGGRPQRPLGPLDELSISLSTVKTHLAGLMNKLAARKRVEIAMWADETGRVRG